LDTLESCKVWRDAAVFIKGAQSSIQMESNVLELHPTGSDMLLNGGGRERERERKREREGGWR